MCTKTKVCRPPEGHMTIILALDIQAIGILEPFGIAVRWVHAAISSSHSCLFTFRPTGCFVRREARRVLTGTFVPQQFFKRRGNKRRISLASASSIRDCAIA